MSKIDLVPITGAQNLSAINENFDKIEEHLNENSLYRKNPQGQPNQMRNDLDMNGHRIYNLPTPPADHEAARLKDVKDSVVGTGNIACEFGDAFIVDIISDTINKILYYLLQFFFNRPV